MSLPNGFRVSAGALREGGRDRESGETVAAQVRRRPAIRENQHHVPVWSD
jgi:hypothetical protein